MILLGNRRRLYKTLDALSIYNDKGIAWSKHSTSQISAQRQDYLAKIRDLVTKLGPETLPEPFLEALSSGALNEDGTGMYAQAVRAISAQILSANHAPGSMSPNKSFKPTSLRGSA